MMNRSDFLVIMLCEFKLQHSAAEVILNIAGHSWSEGTQEFKPTLKIRPRQFWKDSIMKLTER